MTYTFGFNILKFLRNEVNYYVWNPAITGYTWLRNRLRHIPEKQAEFDVSMQKIYIQFITYSEAAWIYTKLAILNSIYLCSFTSTDICCVCINAIAFFSRLTCSVTWKMSLRQLNSIVSRMNLRLWRWPAKLCFTSLACWVTNNASKSREKDSLL